MPLTTVCPLLIQGRTAQAYTFVQLYECPVVQEFSAWENPAMTTFDELHRDILAAFESQVKLNEAQQRLDAVTNEQIERLWTDNAALRDELHAVANRVEGLVRAVTANPADVAAKIVNEANRATLREVRGKASAQSAAAPGKRQGCTPPGRSAKAPERGSHD